MTTIIRSPPATAVRPPAQPHSSAAVGSVIGFLARRDRVRGPVWVVTIVGIVVGGTASVLRLYSTPAEFATYASIVRADAAVKALTGPGYGLDHPTRGAVVMNEMSMFTLVGVALIVMFMVVRHTRAEEESGRAELVRAAPVGRHAALVAAVLWVGAITVAISALVALSMLIWLPLSGSVAFGAAIAALGLVAIGVASLAAQLASTARTANSIAGAALGAMYLLRAIGDLGTGWLSWVSPITWAQGIRAYAGERWWVLLPLVAVSMAMIGGALALSARRDLGYGLLTQRPGAPNGSAALSTPLALAVRLQRISVLGWAVGTGILALFMGLVADQADALADNQAVAELMAAAGSSTLTESFLAMIMLTVALLASGFVVSSVLRLHSEERDLRVSPLLATPVRRRAWLWSHPTVALVGAGIVMLTGGLLVGLGDAISVGDMTEVPVLLVAALTWIPALCVMGAIPIALVGRAPRWAPMAWLAVAYAAIVGLLGQTFAMAQWMRDISPFEHTPQLPAQDFDVLPILVQLAVAGALIGIGTFAFDRRDID